MALLRDPSRVRTNLSDRTFDHFVDQYQTAWTQAPEAPVAEAPHADPAATAQLVPPAQHKVLVNIDFPTAASIPPVSIINPGAGAAGRSRRFRRRRQPDCLTHGPAFAAAVPQAARK